jgi:hypothetical protein
MAGQHVRIALHELVDQLRKNETLHLLSYLPDVRTTKRQPRYCPRFPPFLPQPLFFFPCHSGVRVRAQRKKKEQRQASNKVATFQHKYKAQKAFLGAAFDLQDLSIWQRSWSSYQSKLVLLQ